MRKTTRSACISESKPLLAASGDVQKEARAAWPDEGALRIVPDRAEQYHFKDRMRTLGSFCVMDLTHTTEEANKIRTNKNYNPAKGECNQYILYSDAVQPLPAHSFFEVMSGKADDAAALSAAAVTPLFYIKDGRYAIGPGRPRPDRRYSSCGTGRGRIV